MPSLHLKLKSLFKALVILGLENTLGLCMRAESTPVETEFERFFILSLANYFLLV